VILLCERTLIDLHLFFSVSQGHSGIELLDLLLEPHKVSHMESNGDLPAWSITDQSVSETPFDICEFIWSITRCPSYSEEQWEHFIL